MHVSVLTQNAYIAKVYISSMAVGETSFKCHYMVEYTEVYEKWSLQHSYWDFHAILRSKHDNIGNYTRKVKLRNFISLLSFIGILSVLRSPFLKHPSAEKLKCIKLGFILNNVKMTSNISVLKGSVIMILKSITWNIRRQFGWLWD